MNKTDALRRLDDMRKLKKNWNSYGAEAPNALALRNARTFLEAADTYGLLPYRVAPTSMEGVCFTWRLPGGDREVALEFYNSGKSYALLADDSTEEMDVIEVTDPDTALPKFQDYLFETYSP